MGDTVELPNLAKPEPKGLEILYKFCKGLIQSEVFISKIECQAPVGLLQAVGTLIWKRIEVLHIGNDQRLLPASTESISPTCSVRAYELRIN